MHDPHVRARLLHRAGELQVAVALHLDADEPKVQAAGLKCLHAFKHKYLNQHLERLLRCVCLHACVHVCMRVCE